jgi:hypothetical protein
MYCCSGCLCCCLSCLLPAHPARGRCDAPPPALCAVKSAATRGRVVSSFPRIAPSQSRSSVCSNKRTKEQHARLTRAKISVEKNEHTTTRSLINFARLLTCAHARTHADTNQNTYSIHIHPIALTSAHRNLTKGHQHTENKHMHKTHAHARSVMLLTFFEQLEQN